MISTALYLGTTSIQVSVSTGGVNANVYSGGSLVRQGYAPTYAESSTAPALAAEGDKWWSTSNSTPFRYLSGGWRKLALPLTALYTFTTATFNTGGATGRNGPTLSQARSGLTGTPTPSNWYNTYLNMTTQGYQLWTVPVTGTYTIDAYGAGTPNGGYGGRVQAQFSLTSGNVLIIAIGQQGIGGDGTGNWYAGGGGGGTFVASGSNQASATVLLVAGGGGGRYYTSGVLTNGLSSSGGWALDTISTYASGGTGSGNGSGAGGGVETDGTSGGQSFRNGLVGDTADLAGGVGGFGGGGSGGGNPGGGGGGYRGGNYGTDANFGGSYNVAGQGGTSYINSTGTNTTSVAGTNAGAGYVTITKI